MVGHDVCRKRPEHDVFRYLIVSSLASLFCELLMGLGRPLPLFPYPLMLAEGLLQHLDPPQSCYNVYGATILFSVVVMTYCNAAMFVFRFGQTTDSSWTKFMASPKWGFGIAAAIITVHSVGLVVPVNFLALSPDDVRRAVKDVDHAFYEIIKDRPFVAVEVGLAVPLRASLFDANESTLTFRDGFHFAILGDFQRLVYHSCRIPDGIHGRV